MNLKDNNIMMECKRRFLEFENRFSCKKVINKKFKRF